MNVISTAVVSLTFVLQCVRQLVGVELISSPPATTSPLAFVPAPLELNLHPTSTSTRASTMIMTTSEVPRQIEGEALPAGVAMIAIPLLSQIGWRISIKT
jgi:hypothetical protein